MYAGRESTIVNGQRYAWIGYTLGIACMAALFIAGLVMGKPQLCVMAGSMAALLGAVWASTSVAAKKSASRSAGVQGGA